MYEIESGIPIPPRPTPAGKSLNKRFPLKTMQVGESFVVSANEIALVRSAIFTAKWRNYKQFVTRQTTDGRYRVWRTK